MLHGLTNRLSRTKDLISRSLVLGLAGVVFTGCETYNPNWRNDPNDVGAQFLNLMLPIASGLANGTREGMARSAIDTAVAMNNAQASASHTTININNGESYQRYNSSNDVDPDAPQINGVILEKIPYPNNVNPADSQKPGIFLEDNLVEEDIDYYPFFERTRVAKFDIGKGTYVDCKYYVTATQHPIPNNARKMFDYILAKDIREFKEFHMAVIGFDDLDGNGRISGEDNLSSYSLSVPRNKSIGILATAPIPDWVREKYDLPNARLAGMSAEASVLNSSGKVIRRQSQEYYERKPSIVIYLNDLAPGEYNVLFD